MVKYIINILILFILITLVSFTIDKFSDNDRTERLPMINPDHAFGMDECLTLTGNKLGGS